MKQHDTLRDNFNKIYVRPVQWKLPNVDEKNFKKHKWMGRYTVLMDQKKNC